VLLTLFLFGWVLWFFPYDDLLDRSGTPLGADFSMFYVAGKTVAEGDAAALYDPAAAQTRLHNLFPGIDPHFALPYRYPPLVALVMAPLACLPYPMAIGCFMAMGLASAWLGLRLLLGENGVTSRVDRRLCYLCFLGWPVVLETWVGGQASLFAFLIVSAGIVLMQRERYEWAGAVWALAAYKPNVLLLVVIGCVLFRPRILRGLIPVGAVMFGLTWSVAGWGGILEYIDLTSQLATQPWNVQTPFWKVHGIAQWLTPLIGSQAKLVTLLLGLLATLGIVWRWRQTDDSPRSLLPYALLITVNVLANPYIPIYDLTLLAVGVILLILAEPMRQRYPFARYPLAWHVALATLYFGPHLSQTVSKATGLQLFPLALLGFACFQARMFWNATSVEASGLTPYAASRSEFGSSK